MRKNKVKSIALSLLLITQLAMGAVPAFADHASAATHEGYRVRTGEENYQKGSLKHEIFLKKKDDGKTEAAYSLSPSESLPVEKDNDKAHSDYFADSTGLKEVAPKPRLTDPAALDQAVRTVLYNGYPADQAGLMAKYQLTDYQLRAVTHNAIWYFTDSRTELDGFTSSVPAAVQESMRAAFRDLTEKQTDLTRLPADQKLRLFRYLDPKEAKPGHYLIGAALTEEKRSAPPLSVPEGDREEATPDPEEKRYPSDTYTISIQKLNEEGAGLAGALLRVSREDGSEAASWTSGEEAYILEGLAPGNYSFSEEKAPEGYEKADPFVFRIGEDGQITETSEYAEADGDFLKVTDKKAETAVPEAPVPDDKKDEVPDNQEKPKTEDSENPEAEDDSKKPESDKSQPKADDNEKPNADQSRPKTDDRDKDKEARYEIRIIKIDSAGKALAGAGLTLAKADGSQVEVWTSASEAHLIKLQAGDYKLTESQTPTGYKPAADITFNLSADGKLTASGSDVRVKDLTLEVTGQLLPSQSASPTPAPPVKHEVRISKADRKGKALSGARLQVKKADGSAVDEWTSDQSVHLLKLEAGEYKFIELSAPKGYETVPEFLFKVDDQGKISTQSKDAAVKDNLLTVIDKAKALVAASSRKNKILRAVNTGDPTKLTYLYLFGAAGLVLILLIIRQIWKKKRGK